MFNICTKIYLMSKFAQVYEVTESVQKIIARSILQAGGH